MSTLAKAVRASARIDTAIEKDAWSLVGLVSKAMRTYASGQYAYLFPTPRLPNGAQVSVIVSDGKFESSVAPPSGDFMYSIRGEVLPDGSVNISRMEHIAMTKRGVAARTGPAYYKAFIAKAFRLFNSRDTRPANALP